MWLEGASAAPGDKGVWMRGDAEALADGVGAGSGGGQGDEPAVGRAEFKGLVLRVPAAGFGQHEAVGRIPDIACGEVFADGFPEVLRAVFVPPLFCLVPWGHLEFDAVEEGDVGGAGFGVAATVYCYCMGVISC